MSEWQPIETAPKGGVFIVAHRNGPEINGVQNWHVAMAYRAKNGTIRSETGAHDLTPTAEFWSALPPPPQSH